MCTESNEANTPAVVSAKAFRLVDDAGQERGSFALDHHDNPSFIIRDRHGANRVLVFLSKEGDPSLALNASGGGDKLLLTLGADGTPRVWLFSGGSEEPRRGLLVDADGTAALDLWPASPGGGVSLFAHRDGRLSLTLEHGAEDSPGLGLEVTSDHARIEVRDASGTVRWAAPVPPPEVELHRPE